MNRFKIARLFVGSIAALFAAAVAVPARAQVAGQPYDRDGRYVNGSAPADEYDVQGQAPEYEPDPQEVAPYDGEAGEYQSPVQDAYVDPSARPEGYVVADDCANGCDVTAWDAPYIQPYVGTTIVFGAPVFRLGHWYRPYYHRHGYRSYGRSYNGSYGRSYYGSYARPYGSYGYGSRSYGGSRSYSSPRTYGTYRSYGGSRGWTGTRTYGGGTRGYTNDRYTSRNGTRTYGGSRSDGGSRTYGGGHRSDGGTRSGDSHHEHRHR